MLKNSPRIQSFSHSALGALAFGAGASTMQMHYNQEIITILISGGAQAACTLTNGYCNLRIYNKVKRSVYNIIDNKTVSEWTSASVSGLETLIATLITQKLVGGEGGMYLGMLYGTFTFLMLPTVYEKGFLRKN